MTRRTASDHIHPDQWTKMEQHRFEDRVSAELSSLESAVDKLTVRVTLMLGGLSLIALLLPVISPFIRAWLDIEVPPVPAIQVTPSPG